MADKARHKIRNLLMNRKLKDKDCNTLCCRMVRWDMLPESERRGNFEQVED